MLNIFKLKSNDKFKNTLVNYKKNTVYYIRDYPPAIREWNNSIYVYNKNIVNLIPIAGKLVYKLIKSYFNLYNYKLERKLRKNRLRRWKRRFSSHKIYVSGGEFKHTNNKVIITLYVYNRQKSNYLYKIRKRYLRIFDKFKYRLRKKFFLIRKKGFKLPENLKKRRIILITVLKKKNRLKKYKRFFYKNYQYMYYKKFIKKSFRRLKLFIIYTQLLYINKSKFKHTYVQGLSHLIKKIYNKNVEFNIVNLKYFYFNSDILSQSLTLKIKKNRRKLLKYLNTFIRKVKIRKQNLDKLYLNSYYNKPNILPSLNNFLSRNYLIENFKYNNYIASKVKYNYYIKYKFISKKFLGKVDLLNNYYKKYWINKFFNRFSSNNYLIENLKYNNYIASKIKYNNYIKYKFKPKNYLKEIVLNSIKYKKITGVRLETAGRLTRRYKASRSIHKIRYLGNLKNTYSSYKGLPSIILRNNLKSNIQYTKIKSKTRIGSFGIKGWVSGT